MSVQQSKYEVCKYFSTFHPSHFQVDFSDKLYSFADNTHFTQEAYHHFYNSTPSKEVSKHPPLFHHDVSKLSETSRAKLKKIKEILTMKHKDRVYVHEEIERIIKVCNAQPQHHDFILDHELDSLGGTRQTNN